MRLQYSLFIFAFSLFTACDKKSDANADTADGQEENTGEDLGSPIGITGTTKITRVDRETSDLICDLETAFTGTPYTGECEGCNFAFETTTLESEWLLETTDCFWVGGLTVMNRIAHVNEFTGYDWSAGDTGDVTRSDVFMMGSSNYPDEWYIFASAETGSTFTWNGNNIEVEVYVDNDSYDHGGMNFSLSASLSYE